ncbi:hypothetical protein [Streptomyces sp. NPDC046182]|uniref:hypothetical protein n=1 Tax=Streptomyces sp. NPDC046182 TaxID=3154601 RepID=UPI0033DC491A
MPERPHVAINGCYFMNEGTPEPTDAVPETIQTFGATVRGGEVMGASCLLGKNRHSVVLQCGVQYVTKLATDITVTSGLTVEQVRPYGEVTQWYDTIALPGGRTALVVDAVAGKNSHATAVMGLLRTAIHSLAGFDLGPDELLARGVAGGGPRPLAGSPAPTPAQVPSIGS